MKKLNLFKSEYSKYFLILFSSTVFAQLINILASPILTRLYSPEQYGEYGLFLSLYTILIVISTLRLEFAISIAKKVEEIKTIKKIVLISSLLLAIILLISYITFSSYLVIDITFFTYVSLILVVIIGSQVQVGHYILNRDKNFSLLSKQKYFKALIMSLLGILLGIIGLDNYGLIIANVVAVIILYIILKKSNNVRSIKNSESMNLRKVFKKYRDFPVYNMPSALFDIISIQAPIILFNIFYDKSSVGYYSLTMRTVLLPVNLISSSLSQVFLSKISENYRNKKPFHHITRKLLIILSIIGLIPTVLLYFFSEPLFIFVFGSEWGKAGEFASILSIAVYFRFIASPISNIFLITKSLKQLAILQSFRMISTLTILTYLSNNFEIEKTILYFSIHEMIYYSIYIINIYYVSYKKGR